MKIFNYIRSNPKIILILIGICITVYLMLLFQLDIRAIAIITLLLGYITNVFAGLVALIGFIPIIGPMIVNVFTIPFFWFINSLGYLSSVYAIKKGYGKDLLRHRMITFALLAGIVLGYILGHLIPVQ